jgi:hypothetical protein
MVLMVMVQGLRLIESLKSGTKRMRINQEKLDSLASDSSSEFASADTTGPRISIQLTPHLVTTSEEALKMFKP